MKINGKPHDSVFDRNNVSSSDAGHAQETRSVQELTRELAKSREQSRNAQYKIEALVRRNAGLEKKITELEQKEAKARYLAYHDDLTLLPNRNLLRDRFNQAIQQAKRRHKPLALLILDLDEFKCVNDRLGHTAGDKLLQAVAARLSTCIRGADTACRYGGDEFVIMLTEIDSSQRVAEIIAKLRARIAKPYLIGGYEIVITTSIGAAIFPNDGKTFEDLIKRADLTMYWTKSKVGDVSITTLSENTSHESEIRSRAARFGR